jgi:hypothetical protein
MDLNKVFSYQFEDKQWISKLGIGAVISIIPILNFALSGFLIGIIRNVMNDSEEILPNWDDLGKKFTEGLILFAAGVIYALPLIIIFVPIGIMSAGGLIAGNNHLQGIGQIFAGTGSVLLYCFLCIIMIYGLALAIIYPAVLVMFAHEGTFASCFKFREAFDKVSKNTSPYFTALIVSFVGGLVIGFVFGIFNLVVGWIPCFGWIASIVLTLGMGIYLITIHGYLFGQFGKVAFGQNQPMG